MPKFTLIAEHQDLAGNFTGQVVTHEFTHEVLPNILEDIDLFLRGVGYPSDANSVLEYVPQWEGGYDDLSGYGSFVE